MPVHKEEPPSMLTPEELAQLSGAEELFPSPIPVQFVSSDEFVPSPQTPTMWPIARRSTRSTAGIAPTSHRAIC